MAINLTDFNKIWASTSPLTPYSFSDANYQEGWNFVGSTPPARQMWDSYMKFSDEKQQYIVQNFLPLSGGTMTGAITTSSVDFIKRDVNNGHLAIMGGTAYGSSASIRLAGGDETGQTGLFQLRSQDGVNSKDLIGKPDGTLTWGGKSIPERSYAIDTLSSQAGENTYTFTMSGNSAVIFAKRGNNASISMVTIWDSTATTFVTAGTNPISITTSANNTSVTITNTSGAGVSIKILNGGTL